MTARHTANRSCWCMKHAACMFCWSLLLADIKWSCLELIMVCCIIHRHTVDSLLAQRNGGPHASCFACLLLPVWYSTTTDCRSCLRHCGSKSTVYTDQVTMQSQHCQTFGRQVLSLQGICRLAVSHKTGVSSLVQWIHEWDWQDESRYAFVESSGKCRPSAVAFCHQECWLQHKYMLQQVTTQRRQEKGLHTKQQRLRWNSF